MSIKCLSAALSFLLLFSATGTYAQPTEQNTDSVTALFTRFIKTSTDKSIILLTNRNMYLAGEKIWFKAYVVNTGNGRLDFTSNNLFADLVNDKDSTIQQLVLDNTSLHTNGAFSLPENLPTGFYWIRCYTASQLENNNNGIFLHPLFIINKQLHDESAYIKAFENNLRNSDKYPLSIHFFPERLTSIPGIISTGVIEIKDGYNNPLSTTGELVNSKDSVITSFSTNSLGLARLTFVNAPTDTYTAIFHLNSDTIRYQLPAVNKNAIQLSVINQSAKTIKAFVTLEDAVPGNTHTTILAIQRDSLYYAAVGEGTYGITIPIDNFHGGVARLLLFNGNNNIVSERKIFIPKANAALEIKPDKKKYSARENVDVHIKVAGPNGEPLASVLNVAVEDEWDKQMSDSMEASILPASGEFLLDSWLARYYTKYTADDIDLLMATKTSLAQPLLSNNINKRTEDFDDNNKLQTLTGKITNKNGNVSSNRIVTAIAKNTRDFFMDVDTTDQQGMFHLTIPQGFDSLQLSLQVTDKHRVQILTDSITIDSFHFPHFSTPLSLKQQFLGSNINTLALLEKYHIDTAIIFRGKGWLAPITVKTTKKEELNYDASRRINFISPILTSDKFRYGGYNALGNAILTMPGVSLLFGDIAIFGPSMDLHGNIQRPLLIMDGYELPVSGSIINFLNSLNAADIDFIEVLRGAEAALYGMRGGAGVISINSKHGPDNANYSKRNTPLFNPVTYHVSPTFEMPDYSSKEIKNSLSPDPRTTIYWNGNVITYANGEADIHFYTADNNTGYTVTVTGITAKGDVVYKRVIISSTGRNR